MSTSYFAQERDSALARHYQQVADLMRADIESFRALHDEVEVDKRYGTFALAYADLLQRDYAKFIADITEAADQAQTIADDYRAHAEGTAEPLVAS